MQRLINNKTLQSIYSELSCLVLFPFIFFLFTLQLNMIVQIITNVLSRRQVN